MKMGFKAVAKKQKNPQKTYVKGVNKIKGHATVAICYMLFMVMSCSYSCKSTI